jgi:monoterpene epsilon-lactone hydrolase
MTMPSDKFERFLELVRRTPVPQHLDIAETRMSMERHGGRLPDGVVGTPVTVGEVRAEWIDAVDGVRDRAILYLHGGGFVSGSIDSHRNLTGHLAKAAQCRVLALDYRLAPEHPHPAQVTDAVAAYAWLLEQGLPAEHLIVAGDSAGGGLAVTSLHKARELGLPLPAGVVAMSPLVDLETAGASMTVRAADDPMVSRELLMQMIDCYIGGGDRCDPTASPMHCDLTGFPPMLVQVGEAEVLLDDATRLVALAESSHVETNLQVWTAMTHVFQFGAGHFPEADAAISHVAGFCRRRTGLPV